MEKKLPEALSLKTTPNEIKNKEFKKTALGYSPREVVGFLDVIAKAWEKVQRHEKDLVTMIGNLQEQISSWELREAQITIIHEKALKDAEKMREEAMNQAEKMFCEVEEKANQVRVNTEEWLAQVISEVEETERQKMNFMNAFKSEPLGAKLNRFLKLQMSEKLGALQ